MKHLQKGFIGIGAVIAIVALLAIAGTVTYSIKHNEETATKTNDSIAIGSDVDVSYEQADGGTGALTITPLTQNVAVTFGGQGNDASACSDVISKIDTALNVTFAPVSASSAANGSYGTRLCSYNYFLTGSTSAALSNTIATTLSSDGWVRNPRYDADGVSGGSFVLEKNGIGAEVSYLWKNKETVCPPVSGMPISESCSGITAGEQLYEVTITLQKK